MQQLLTFICKVFNFKPEQNIYRCYNLNQKMKNLAYIPTKVDKDKLYAQIDHKYQNQSQNSHNYQEDSEQVADNKKLSKEQLNALLMRLTRITKKQYDTQQQTTHIVAANQELKRRRLQSQKVQNRLIDYGKKVSQKKIEKKGLLQNQIRQKYYRDIPVITQKGKNLNQKSIDMRLQQVINQRNNHKESLKIKYQPLFKPTIDPHSEFINDLQDYGDLHSRMEIKEKEAVRRKQSLLKKLQMKSQFQMPFKPQINQKSRQIADKMPRRPLSIPSSIKKHQEDDSRTLDLTVYPFAPEINKNTQQLLKNKRQNYDPNCFQRLYSQAKELSKKNHEKLQQKYNRNNFKPTINQKSLKIIDRKRQMQETIHDTSIQQYEQIKIGYSETQNSRAKCYSMKNLPQKQKKQEPMNFKQQFFNILNKGNRMRMSHIR